MSATTLERPVKHHNSAPSGPAAPAISVRRVFRVEVAGRDGVIDVRFVPMHRGGSGSSTRSAVSPQPARTDAPALVGG
jgi:hypothetical protein